MYPVAAFRLIPVPKLILAKLACRVSLYNSTLHCIGKPLRSLTVYVRERESTVQWCCIHRVMFGAGFIFIFPKPEVTFLDNEYYSILNRNDPFKKDSECVFSHRTCRVVAVSVVCHLSPFYWFGLHFDTILMSQDLCSIYGNKQQSGMSDQQVLRICNEA